MAIYAPKVAFQSNLTVDFTIDNGNPILVHSIQVGQDSAVDGTGTVDVKDNDDNILFRLASRGSASVHVDIPFVASNGLKLSGTVNPIGIYATVLYEGSG